MDRRVAILGSILWLCLGLQFVGCAAEKSLPEASDSAAAASEYPAAPSFELEALDGGQIVRLEELLGKVVVLDFWATWCPPCEHQVPELNAVFAAHRAAGDPVVVYGVSVDRGEAESVQEWVTEKGVEYPILLGGDDLAQELGAVGYPTLYVIGPDGSLRQEHVGVILAAELESSIQAASSPAL